MEISSKLPKVGTTIFSVMSQLALSHKAVNLGQGFPDFEPPPALLDALSRHIREGRNQYAPMTGVAKLREQIARKTLSLYQREVNPESDITITSGATEALFAAIAAIVVQGDEVIVLDPCYDSYEPAIELNGARAVHVALDSNTFRPDWNRIKAAITKRTRMIIINTPHNPCGSVFELSDWQTLTELLRGTRILVLSDEVYEHIIFDGHRHESVLRYPELAERAFVVSSFGKTYHVTGWKVGYCIAPPKYSAEFRKVHQYLTFCTFNAAQWAFADMLETDPQHYLDLPLFYQNKRDQFAALLGDTAFKLLPVSGAYFQIVDYSAISERDDLSFCEWLVKDIGVAAIPVSAFYEAPPSSMRLIRFCFAKNDATLIAAAEKLKTIPMRKS